jgi:hypothetical protein
MQSSLESLARSLGQDDDDDDELQATFMRIALCDFSQSEQTPSATRFSLVISIWITTGARKAPSASMHQDFPGAYASGSQQKSEKACLVKKWQC